MIASLKTLELLFLGILEKGSMSMSSKVQSISDRWFSQNSRTEPSKVDWDKALIEEQNGLFIQRTSLIQLKCKRGGLQLIKYYCILVFFSKYMDK